MQNLYMMCYDANQEDQDPPIKPILTQCSTKIDLKGSLDDY